MSYRKLKIASVVVTAALALLGAIALTRLPAGTELPTHWNAAGEPDNFAPASYALFMPAFLCALVSAMMAALPRIEPMQDRLEQSAALFQTGWAGLLGLMLLLGLRLAAPAFGIPTPAALPLAGTGALLMLIGNALPKSRPGFFVGIRTPWTLTDTDNWIATHRVGGWTLMAAGLAITVAAMAPLPAATRAAVVSLAVLIAVAVPVLFSFAYWWRVGRRRGAR
jgi:uncharacterized membrane protein